MATMRAVAAAVVLSFAFVVVGCGGSTRETANTNAASGAAATLVPSDAKLFLAVDTQLDSQQWQRLDTLTRNFPARAKVIGRLLHGLDWKDDVAPALGPEADVAQLANDEFAAFTKPNDEGKLRALAAKLSTGNERYSVQSIAGWSVVADSQDTFASVRAAESGTSLGDTAAFHAAWSAVSGDGVARVYVKGRRSTPTGVEFAHWLAARASADQNAIRIDGAVQPAQTLQPLAQHSLLGDVPSEAALAIAFRGTGDLPLSSLMLPLPQLQPLFAGGGVLYVRPAGLIPDVAIELAPKDPQKALTNVRALLRSLAGKLGPVQLTAQVTAGKIVVADSPQAASALRSGPKLVDDASFKDVLEKAGVPQETSFLAYADASQLAPFVPILIQAITGKAPDPALGDNLEHVGSVIAWANREGGRIKLHLWLRPR